MEALIENEVTIIEWITLKNKPCLKFTYREILTENEAEKISEEWLNNLENLNHGKFNLVFDCKTAENYQTLMKYFWSALLIKLKSYIDQIWVLTK